MVHGSHSEEDVKVGAKRIARLIQKCGHEGAHFSGFAITSLMARADLPFPVRLDQLASSSWRRHALYEPEIYCGCVFRIMKPSLTFQVTAGGKVMVSGTRSVADAQEALRRIYPILIEFQK